jgi:predicted transcriptional regulator
MTKNLTLSVPEHALERFRILAAERKTSVNALVRKFIEDSVGLEERRRAAIARMLDLGTNTGATFDMHGWDRAASYERN